MYDIAVKILGESWSVLGEMAPYLLFGFAIAGVLSVVISPEWTERHLGGRGIRPVVEAALWGVPLPLCSCGVIPVAASMRRHGASRAATTAFLLSTPQTGVDSIAVTYALLGPVFAVFRPIAALVSGLLGGVLVLLFGQSRGNDAHGPAAPPACTDQCCTTDRGRHRLRRAAYHGFVSLPRDLAPALLLGVVIAGAISALLPPGQLHLYLGGGIVSIVLLMAVGIPLYVCATASVPIAAGLMYVGASPGAALAFLIAGPATNAATIATVWKILGRRAALLYLLTVAVSAVGCGLVLDGIVALVPVSGPQLGQHVHAMQEGGWASTLWAILLLAVLGGSYLFPAIIRRWSATVSPGDLGPARSEEHATTCCGAVVEVPPSLPGHACCCSKDDHG